MSYNFNWKYFVAFIALMAIMGELHEQAHTTTGYLLGGCYGARDFNVWGLCQAAREHELNWLPTLIGPIFTFAIIWLAAVKFKAASTLGEKSLWFTLFFANIPFARIFTSATMGGDEFLVMRKLFLVGEPLSMDGNWFILWPLTVLIIVAIVWKPIKMIYQGMPDIKKKRMFAGFFILPMFAAGLIMMGVLNTMLKAGVMAETGILGAPIIVNIWFFLCIAVVWFMRGDLKTIFKE